MGFCSYLLQLATAAETLIEATEAIQHLRKQYYSRNCQRGGKSLRVPAKDARKSCPSQFALSIMLGIARESHSNHTTLAYSCDHFLKEGNP
jgi:hypothetical protein